MDLGYLRLIAYFWVRAAVFSGGAGRALEKRLLERRGAQAGFRVDGYLDALDVLLARIRRESGKPLNNLGFLELGSGQTLLLPVMLRLLGARSVVSVDISDLSVLAIMKDLLTKLRSSQRFMQMLPVESAVVFPPQSVIDGFDSVRALLGYFGVSYLPDCDLSQRSSFVDGVFSDVNIVYSNNVLEHIPESVLLSILENCRGYLLSGVIHVHLVDLGDHFADAMSQLNPLNFLRYTDFEWRLIAGNRYIYQNRLRQGDYARLFRQVFKQVALDVVESVEAGLFADFETNIQKDFLSCTPKEQLSTLRLLVSAR